MTRLKNQQQVQHPQVIQHFSHAHPLQLNHLNLQATCACCKHSASGNAAYWCSVCAYPLHVKCAKLPKVINHIADPHPLKLLPFPAHPNGVFNCDACGGVSNGFSYHCDFCSIDVHAQCAILPQVVSHRSHPHKLSLTVASPYGEGEGFCCDICGTSGGIHWLYRCAACGFDAHLTCGSNTPAPVQLSKNNVGPSEISRSPYQPPPVIPTAAPFAGHFRPTVNPLGSVGNVSVAVTRLARGVMQGFLGDGGRNNIGGPLIMPQAQLFPGFGGGSGIGNNNVDGFDMSSCYSGLDGSGSGSGSGGFDMSSFGGLDGSGLGGFDLSSLSGGLDASGLGGFDLSGNIG